MNTMGLQKTEVKDEVSDETSR